MEVRELKIEHIRSQGLQIRCAMDRDTIARYAEVFKSGRTMRPIVVFDDSVTRWLADGFHRIAGAKRAGRKTITTLAAALEALATGSEMWPQRTGVEGLDRRAGRGLPEYILALASSDVGYSFAVALRRGWQQ